MSTMLRRTPRFGKGFVCCAITATSIVLTAAAGYAAAPEPIPSPVPDVVATPLAGQSRLFAQQVNDSLGLKASQVVTMEFPHRVGQPLMVMVPIDGDNYLLDLQPHSTRAPGYRVLTQIADGSLVEVAPSPVRTLRGEVMGLPNSRIAGSLLDDGLHVMIEMGDGETVWLQPLADRVPNAPAHGYALYSSADVLPHGGTCAIPNDKVVADQPLPPAPLALAGAGTPCIAELACDADFEYFSAHGSSVATTQADINAVINTMNLQYESQVGLTHQITTIVVRSSANDPYTATDPTDLLCQFITEWTNNQTGIQRDVAHFFTGRNIAGGVIGIASDIGGTGICVNNGSCFGGPFGTQGSYCLAQSDFNGNFACATDLSAHELGHLWGAFHCSCPGNTMNPSITCTNSFSTGSINSITAFAATLPCLTGTNCGVGGGPGACCFSNGTCSQLDFTTCSNAGGTFQAAGVSCAAANCPQPATNDLCVQASLIPSTTSFAVDNTNAGPGGGNDPDLPAGSPSCQWQGIPNNTHNTIWYQFVATDTSVEIRTCNTTDISDTILALYQGTCGNLTEMACSEDVVGCGTSNFHSTLCFNGLNLGETYLFMVGNPGGWAGSLPGIIQVQVTTPCPAIGPVAGACCFPDGSCLPLLSNDCNQAGGSFQGVGVTCAQANCPPPNSTGACCLPSGACIDNSTAGNCQVLGGTYQGDGTNCATANCPQPTGACCFPDGTCADGLTATGCQTQGGTYQGDGTNCAAANCPQPTGACCLPSGACIDNSTAGNCQVLGGTYQGDGTNCATANCPTPTPCPGDIAPAGGNGTVNIDDLVALLGAFGPCPAPPAACPADIAPAGGNGIVNIDDLIALLGAFGPCP